ncbi:UDP-glucuronosyl/UDP-glucosyltransferase - like 10 [Theobroma cacao]|nr:UDP-glucuronosyl/UDP-glucosyltransferase - like 10 [Theobroma cacao]
MGGEIPPLHVLFFPFMGLGHMIPAMDMTKLFAMRGVETTIVTTPLNVPFFSESIQRCKNSGINIDIRILKFPCVGAGLPEGCENLDAITNETDRGKKASIDEQKCLNWLDSKEPNSVVYIYFGSVSNFNAAQLMEIALAIEASGQQFIWVVRKEKNNEDEEDWLPEGFEKRMEGKGLIIRGWAPQVLILDHEAVGGFVTHCEWNSTFKSVSAGLSMVTSPAFAEQFYNEKLVTQVLKIGVGVRVQKWVEVVGDSVKRDAIEEAVRGIMVGERAEEMRSRAKALGEMAKGAVEEGGSSDSDLNALI